MYKRQVVEGENLDLLIGSQPLEGTEKDAVKAMTLKLLNDKYGIEEEDFQMCIRDRYYPRRKNAAGHRTERGRNAR